MNKILTALLATSLAVYSTHAAESTGSVAGRVIAPRDRPAPTKLWIAPSGAGAQPMTVPIAPDGTFHATAVPAGTVELAIENSEGLFAVTTPIAIAPGTTRSLQLALGGRQDSSDVPPPADAKKKKRPGGVWANPLYATLIVVGSAIVVGVLVNELTQSNDKPASESTP
jgi:hypothetical protein